MLQQTNVSSQTDTTPIDDYVLERIDYRARRLAIQFGLSDEERDDYAQDMVVEVLTAIKKHDPSQSTHKTFINRVLDMFLKNAIRTEIHQRRRECNNPIPLDNVSEGFTPVVNDPRHGELSEVDQLDMKMDFEEILSRMPQQLQCICNLLKDYSVAETAKKLGINRTAIYRHLAEVREYFQRGGYEFSDFCATDLV